MIKSASSTKWARHLKGCLYLWVVRHYSKAILKS